MMDQLKRWFSTPRGILVTAFVIIVIAVLGFRSVGKGSGATAKGRPLKQLAMLHRGNAPPLIESPSQEKFTFPTQKLRTALRQSQRHLCACTWYREREHSDVPGLPRRRAG